MKNNIMTYLVMICAIILVIFGGLSLNQFELTGNNGLDYFRFALSIGAIIMGVMVFIISTISLRSKK